MQQRTPPTPPTYRAMNNFNEANVLRDRIGRFANKPSADGQPEADSFAGDARVDFDPRIGLMRVHAGVLEELPWADERFRDQVKKIVVEEGTAARCSLIKSFDGMKNLEEVELPDSFFIGQRSTYAMFRYCDKLRKVNVADWSMSGVNNFGLMFSGCKNLRHVDVSGWDTQCLETADSMFHNSGIENFNAGGWNTECLEYTTYMFAACSELKTADASGWDTSEIKNASGMLSLCSELPQR